MLPSEGGYNNNAACVGGGTLSYGAKAWRFSKDFRMRSTYGAPEGSSLEDWPISYDDLSRSTKRRVRDWCLRGRPATPSRGPAQSASHASAPAQPRVRHPGAGGKALGLHPFHMPMARNIVPYNGRGPAACAAAGAAASPAK